MADPVTTEKPTTGNRSLRNRAAYDGDYYGWVEEQVALLRAGRLDEIDVENIAEELSDMGRTEYHRLHSALKVLVMHMLKWDQQPEHRSSSWEGTIREHRQRIARLLKKNPGLRPRLEEALAEGYEDARICASTETHIPDEDFPKECPYGWDDVLDRPFRVDR